MPHFVIDCSSGMLKKQPEDVILNAVFEEAVASGLFRVQDIKVRVNPYQNNRVGETNEDFLHIFGNIMEGRTPAQKARLSKAMVTRMAKLFPDVPMLAMNISEFEKLTYCHRRNLDL